MKQTKYKRLCDSMAKPTAVEPINVTADMIADLHALQDKLRQYGEMPTQVRISQAMLTPERGPAFLAECQRLGIAVRVC